MKLAGYSTCLLIIAIFASAHSKDVAYDLTNKNQFTFYFREQWKTMFNTPQPVANPAKQNIIELLADEVYFQPCYTVARRSGRRYFTDRLWGMMHALNQCDVESTVLLPADPTNKRPDAVFEMEFIQTATYTSYTKKLHKISMEMKARQTDANSPFRIYRITETCSNQ